MVNVPITTSKAIAKVNSKNTSKGHYCGCDSREVELKTKKIEPFICLPITLAENVQHIKEKRTLYQTLSALKYLLPRACDCSSMTKYRQSNSASDCEITGTSSINIFPPKNKDHTLDYKENNDKGSDITSSRISNTLPPKRRWQILDSLNSYTEWRNA